MNESDIIGYRERAVPARWRPVLARTWTQRVASVADHRQLVLPDGHADVLVDGAGRAVLVGPATGATRPLLPAGTEWHGLRLAFGAVRPLCGVPAAELTDRVVPLDALLGGPRTRLLADAMVGRAPAARAGLRRWLDGAAPDRRVRWAAAELWRHPGSDVTAVAARAGCSSRQLRRVLAAELGLNPRGFQRIARLRRFLAAAQARPARGLAELAAEAGYADQPHLSREARALSGLTAAALAAFQRGPRVGSGHPAPRLPP